MIAKLLLDPAAMWVYMILAGTAYYLAKTRPTASPKARGRWNRALLFFGAYCLMSYFRNSSVWALHVYEDEFRLVSCFLGPFVFVSLAMSLCTTMGENNDSVRKDRRTIVSNEPKAPR